MIIMIIMTIMAILVVEVAMALTITTRAEMYEI